MLYGMSERGGSNWQPIDMLPVLASMVAEMLDGAAEQERLLREAPRYSLDADTLDNVERVYRDGAEDHGLYREQAARWQRFHSGAPGLAEFAAGVAQLDPAYTRVLLWPPNVGATRSRLCTRSPTFRSAWKLCWAARVLLPRETRTRATATATARSSTSCSPRRTSTPATGPAGAGSSPRWCST
jgi:hypothetical protein